MSGVDDKNWSWNLINADSPEHVCNVLYAIASETGVEFWPEEGYAVRGMLRETDADTEPERHASLTMTGTKSTVEISLAFVAERGRVLLGWHTADADLNSRIDAIVAYCDLFRGHRLMMWPKHW